MDLFMHEGVLELPPNDNSITTGPVGFGASVIVFYDFDGLKYQHARAQCPMGGIEDTSWEALLEGVPDTAETQVLVIVGRLMFQQQQIVAPHLMEQVTRLVRSKRARAMVRFAGGYQDATVDRQGLVTATRFEVDASW